MIKNVEQLNSLRAVKQQEMALRQPKNIRPCTGAGRDGRTHADSGMWRCRLSLFRFTESI